MVISENCCNFIVFNYKVLQTIIAMITEDKVTELFCMADDFCTFFDAMMEKYTLKSDTKRRYHRDSTMSKAEIMLIMILFHDSGYRCLKHFYGSSDIWSDSMLKKKTAEQFVYLNNDKQMYSYEQQFSISCLGFV